MGRRNQNSGYYNSNVNYYNGANRYSNRDARVTAQCRDQLPSRRRLKPEGAPTHQGLIVTPPLDGHIVHYVYCGSPTLFTMSYDLFQYNSRYPVRKTELVRREQLLKFGDNIIFTANEHNVILDYQTDMPVYETTVKTAEDNHLHYLVKTIGVLPPQRNDHYALTIWTTSFGLFEMTEDEVKKANMNATNDITLYCWIGMDVNHNTHKLAPYFYEFVGEVAVDDRQIAWNTDWNYKNKPSSGLTWDLSDDESDNLPLLLQKNDAQLLSIKTKLEGVLIGHKELYCPKLPNYRVFVGVWPPEMGYDKVPPTDQIIFFDAFYSDIRNDYIAFALDVETDRLGDVELHLDGDFLPTITVPVYFNEAQGGGGTYETYFGRIADPARHLETLPYQYTVISPADEEYVDYAHVTIRDLGPDHIVRFVIDENLPAETREKIKLANSMAEIEEQNEINQSQSEGFVVSPYTRRFFSPDYPEQRFEFPREVVDEFPVGHWAKFKAVYSSEDRVHYIVEAEINAERRQIPYSYVRRNKHGKEISMVYEFRIDVEYQKNDKDPERYLLYSNIFGYVSDIDRRFVPRPNIRSYSVIVAEDLHKNAFSLFKLIRMALAKEKMASETHGEIVEVNDDEDSDENDLGLEAERLLAFETEKQSQVEYNSEFSIRERRLEATKRRRERRKLEKELGLTTGGEDEDADDEEEEGEETDSTNVQTGEALQEEIHDPEKVEVWEEPEPLEPKLTSTSKSAREAREVFMK